MTQLLQRGIWQHLTILYVHLPFNLVISFLEIFLKDTAPKMCVEDLMYKIFHFYNKEY